MIRRVGTAAAVMAATLGVAACADPAPAEAVSIAKPICTLAGLVSGIAGKVCSAASHAGNALNAGKKLLGGHLGGALKALSGASTAAKALTAGAVLASIVAWVSGGAKVVLEETAKVISATTRPQLQSSWFSASYWRMAAISALLTMPFLFAAVIQALMHSDLAMVGRAALGYLPLGLLCVSIAAPVTTLLLSASDEMSAIISGASGSAGATFLTHVSLLASGLSQFSGSTFLLLFVGLLTVAATVTLWVELLIRAAAVYVVVLMLPLFFAALVWPARRVWAVRALELLVALILSKFVIVAVLSLGGAALAHTTLPSITQALAGTTLVILAAFSPWALVRLLPLHELAGGLEGLRTRSQSMLSPARADDASEIAQELVQRLPAQLPARAAGAARPGAVAGEPDAAAAAVNGLDHGEEEVASGEHGEASGEHGEASGEHGKASGEHGEASSEAAGGGKTDEAEIMTIGEPGRSTGSRAPDPQSQPHGAAGPTRSERLSEMEPHWRAENGAWGTIDLSASGLAEEPSWIGHEPSSPDDLAAESSAPGPPDDGDPLSPAPDPGDAGPLRQPPHPDDADPLPPAPDPEL